MRFQHCELHFWSSKNARTPAKAKGAKRIENTYCAWYQYHAKNSKTMQANFVYMRIFRIQNIYRLTKWMYRMKNSAQIWARVSKKGEGTGEKGSMRVRKSKRKTDREKAREREKEIKTIPKCNENQEVRNGNNNSRR